MDHYENYKAFLYAAINKIQDALENNYLSIFAGAGISKDSKLPTWPELMQEIYNDLYKGQDDKYINKESYEVTAEKFYNQFKENHYYQTLNKLIPNHKKQNDLHNCILDLNIKNLITTNWDNLFEKAIDNKGLFYDIVKEDEDMGYVGGFSKFIKAHGSLDTKNIVFKESDYLNYSNNFPLIENYIKGVFSTDLVMMIGYSLSDPNIKQIISWVNSKASSIKPVYFIKTQKNFDSLEFENYKAKNIYILYLNEIIQVDSHREQLISFLKMLNNLENTENNSALFAQKVERFYKQYENCNFIFANSFIKDFRKYFSVFDEIYLHNNRIHIKAQNETMEQIAQNETMEQILKYSEKYLQKMSNLLNIQINELKPENTISIDYDLILFDYDVINEKINNLSLKDMTNDEELCKAYLLYKNERTEEAYITLRKLAKTAFKDKNYTTWMTCLINMENFIFKYNINEDTKKIDNFLKEIAKIDIEKYYARLPNKNKTEIRDIKNIKNYALKTLIEITNIVNKIKKDHKIYTNGGFSKNNHIDELNHHLLQTIFIEQKLKATIDLSDIYKQATEGNLIYLSLLCHKAISSKNANPNTDITMPTINIMFASFAIKYFKDNDLVELLETYFKDFTLNIDNESFVKMFNNICRYFIKIAVFETTHSRLFDNFLILSSYIKLDQKTFNSIIGQISNKLEQHLFGIKQYENMDMFVYYQYKNNNEIDFSKIQEIIQVYLKLFLENKYNFYDKMALTQSAALNNTLCILSKEQYKLEEETNITIREAIHKLKNTSMDLLLEFTDYMFIYLVNIVDYKTKEIINNSIKELYDNFKQKDYYKILKLAQYLHTTEQMSEQEKQDYEAKYKK